MLYLEIGVPMWDYLSNGVRIWIVTLHFFLLCCCLFFLFFFFFFFQAEDGIRDLYVTGVQTCALPIFQREARVGDHVEVADREVVAHEGVLAGVLDRQRLGGGHRVLAEGVRERRSEERRVGKSVDHGGRRIIKKTKKRKKK